MSSLELPEPDEQNRSRFAVRIAVASLVLLTFAGALMWWRFGPVIFVDLLTAMQNCF
jgi:hypothetical protein